MNRRFGAARWIAITFVLSTAAFAQSGGAEPPRPADAPANVVLEPVAIDAGVEAAPAPVAEVPPPPPDPVEPPPPPDARTFQGETVVTGSRLKRKELVGPAPVTIFTSEQIKASGRLNVGEFLQTIPQQSNAINRNANNGGDGAIRVNLRGLGAASTLVLLNGRRLAPGGTGADSSVDLSAIPTNVIDRIEVLADGASAVYGSDAIGGVINIITLRKFEGAELNLVGGVSSRGDGQTLDLNGVVGTSNEKGSILFSLGYYNSQPVFAGNRDYSQTQKGFDSVGMEEYRLGSGTVPGGRIIIPGGQAGLQNGNSAWNDLVQRYPNSTNFTRDLTTGAWRPFKGPNLPVDNGDGYNFQPYNYLVTPQERINLFTSGEYRLASFARVYFDGFFTKRTSTQELAPEPLVGDGEGLIVSARNVYNPFGRDFAAVRRRLSEFGGRITTQDVSTSHAVAGLDGTLGPLERWTWDVNFNFSRNEATNVNVGNLRVPRLQNAVGPSFIASDGTPTCGTPDAPIASCVPLNLFGGPGSITKDQVESLRYTGIARGFNQMLGAQATVGGDLFRLWAERPVGLAVGYEFRDLQGGFIPDPITAAGETSGNKSLPTGGRFNVNEVYGELAIPLIDKLPGIERLELTAAGRLSAYSNFGTTLNYKFGARYSPIRDLALRGTISSAFRAPTVPELFGGQADNFANVSDPCGAVEPGTPRAMACGAAANNGDDQNQLRSRVGGNTALRPEVARRPASGRGALLRGQPLVQLVVPLVPHHLAFALEDEEGGRHLVEEVAVVGHQQHGAGELQQQPLEHVERHQVEVVRRLVEHQHVGALEEEAREEQPVALSAGQALHLHALHRHREEQVVEVLGQAHLLLAERHPVVVPRGLEDRLVLVERGAELVIVHHLRLRAAAHRAGVGRQFSQQRADERRLARAILPQQRQPLTGLQNDADVIENFRLSEGLLQVTGLDDGLREARRCGELEFRHLRPLEPLLAEQLAGALDAGLRLRATRLGASAQPRHLLGNPLLAFVFAGLLVLEVDELLLEVRLVVAGVADEATGLTVGDVRLDLDDAVDEAVEERAVVRDEEQRGVARVELVFEPFDRLGVEVVGGLVEHEEVGVGEERARDGDAFALAAGELLDGLVPARRVDAEAVEELSGFVRGVPAAEVLDALDELGQAVEHPLVGVRLERGREPFVFVERVAQGLLGDGELTRGGGAGAEDGLLREVARTQAALDLQRAGVGLHLAGEHLHQGGLAAAVDADEADAFARFDDELEVREEGAAAEGEGQVESAKERHPSALPHVGQTSQHDVREGV
jgi:outer membrane receptor protein involved in Fe transport